MQQKDGLVVSRRRAGQQVKISRYCLTRGCRKAHHVAPSQSVTLVSSAALTHSRACSHQNGWHPLFLASHLLPVGERRPQPKLKKRCSCGTKAAPVRLRQRSKQHRSKASPQQSHGTAVEREAEHGTLAIDTGSQAYEGVLEQVGGTKPRGRSEASEQHAAL